MSALREIYLDYAATTPLDPNVASAMADCVGGEPIYGNPSANHAAGLRARSAIEEARGQCAALINAASREIVFTSGATEADNLAVIGGARFRAHRGRHIVTMASEHKAVLGAADALEQEGFRVTRLAPRSGRHAGRSCARGGADSGHAAGFGYGYQQRNGRAAGHRRDRSPVPSSRYSVSHRRRAGRRQRAAGRQGAADRSSVDGPRTRCTDPRALVRCT